MSPDQHVAAADELVQEALRLLGAGCRKYVQVCLMEALAHIQALRHYPDLGPAPTSYIAVATEHGWE